VGAAVVGAAVVGVAAGAVPHPASETAKASTISKAISFFIFLSFFQHI
jgi:hypothetical protein